MKTKIFALLLATVLVLTAFAAVVTPAAAILASDEKTYDQRILAAVNGGINTTYIGECLNFTGVGAGTLVSFDPYDSDDAPFTITANTAGNAIRDTASSPVDPGKYNVSWGASTSAMYFVTPDLGLKLKVGTEAVTSVTKGQNLTVSISGEPNDVNATLEVKKGIAIKEIDGNSKDLTDVPIATLKAQGLNTTGWSLGTYIVTLKTNEDEGARSLVYESAPYSLEIRAAGITLTSSTTSPVKGKTFTITILTGAGNFVNLTSTGANFTLKKGYEGLTAETGAISLKDVGSDGEVIYVAVYNKTGSYTLTATNHNTSDTDTATITVGKPAVELSVESTTVVIGEKIKLTGTANTGTSVDLFVEETYLVKDNLAIVDGAFSYDIPSNTATGWELPGSISIDVIVDSTYASAADVDVDDTIAILLVSGELTAEQPDDVIAQGDKYKVKGTATGVGEVAILRIGPKGGADFTWYDPAPGTDDTYEEEITIGKTATTGTYTVLVISAGRDGKYGGYDDLAALQVGVDFGTKTTSQVIDIVKDATTGQAGSDDILLTLEFKVESPTVILDAIADVAVGEPLVVTGTSNRATDTTILVTVKGPDELTPQSIKVEDGVFNTTFDTAGATVGTYTVKADDGDGHTDTATVNIVTEVAPAPTAAPTATPEPTAKPTAAPAPTAAPTAEPTAEPTPEPPGFEAVFAIAGLLSIAYLVLRKRRE